MERLANHPAPENSDSKTEKPIWVGYQKDYFQEMQHKDRLALKEALSKHDKDKEKTLRTKIRERRKGPKGLRALDRLTRELNRKY